MSVSHQVSELAEAVADGLSLDWSSAEGSDPESEDTIAQLRDIEAIGHLFASLTAGRPSSTPERLVLPSGAYWGTLKIIEHVGRGRFGDVYRAWDPALDREVALKLIADEPGDEHGDAQVVEEGRLMARVRHPNVATIHGAQKLNGSAGLWMEFVEGRTLAVELAERGPFGAEELARVGIELCHALAAVHAAGLVHRDVKAQNVMRDRGGRIILGDFGTGREVDHDQSAVGGLAGTPAYLAPEIFARQAATAQSDLYSLGTLLFHLATRDYPFQARSLRALRDAHGRGQRTPLRSLRGDLSERLTSAIERALDPEPSRRFENAASMARALEACLPRAQTPLLVRRRVVLSIAAAAILLTLAGGAWVAWDREAIVPFEARDWVLITVFENRTGDPLLEGTLEHALERELSDSSFVNVAPRARVEDTLALMRKPADTRVDAALGREVALRDGEIRAVIAGRADKIGNSYLLSAQVVNPSDGLILANVTEPSVGSAGLLAAVVRLATGVRARLGEELPEIQQSGEDLPKVTTNSLRALHFFARALAVQGGYAPMAQPKLAEQLLRDAIKEDPEFVAAHVRLAQVITSQRGRLAEAREQFERAVAISQRGSAIDRYFALGSYHVHRARFATDPREKAQHYERAEPVFAAWLQTRPDSHVAVGWLLGVHREMGRPPDTALAKRFVQLRPNNLNILKGASQEHLRAADVDAARQYARRARELNVKVDPSTAHNSAWVRAFFIRDAWLQHNPTEAGALADQMMDEMQALDPESASLFAQRLVSIYEGLGRLDRAEQVGARIQDAAARKLLLGRVVSSRGRRDLIRAFLAREYATIEEAAPTASLFVDAGLLESARRALGILKGRPGIAPAYIALVEGQLALAEGQPDRAIQRLEPLLNTGWVRAPVTLAEVLAAKGDTQKAIEILERASQRQIDPNPDQPGGSDHVFLDRLDRLAQLYRKAGRIKEADAVESDLRTRLAVADDDHPIRRRLTASVAQPR